MLCYTRVQAWAEALSLAEALVRARRGAVPPQPELLALALGSLGLIQFARDRAAEADATFDEYVRTWRAVLNRVMVQAVRALGRSRSAGQ